MILEIDNGNITVSADTLAGHFGIAPEKLHPLMRAGKITGLVEKGAGKDHGRYRLTFRYAGRRVRMICDKAGQVLHVTRTILEGRSRVP